MKAMLLQKLGAIESGSRPLLYTDIPSPSPGDSDVLLRVRACGVCHTELDEIEGRTPPPRLPIVLGHQAIGQICEVGRNVRKWHKGDRAGVAWIHSACRHCQFCRSDRENLCPQFEATGRDCHGGYAEYLRADADFVHQIPTTLSDSQAAPLLCAGAIGYRSLGLTNLRNGEPLGLTGFGSSAQLVLKMARHRFPSSPIYVFARSSEERVLAVELGAAWAGHTTEKPPTLLNAVIVTTPAWTPIVAALANLSPGGRLVVNAIRKESADQAVLTELNYATHLWQEKEIKSVANVTRHDVREFLVLAAIMKLVPQVQEYPLSAANEALIDLKMRPVTAAKVLVMDR